MKKQKEKSVNKCKTWIWDMDFVNCIPLSRIKGFQILKTDETYHVWMNTANHFYLIAIFENREDAVCSVNNILLEGKQD